MEGEASSCSPKVDPNEMRVVLGIIPIPMDLDQDKTDPAPFVREFNVPHVSISRSGTATGRSIGHLQSRNPSLVLVGVLQRSLRSSVRPLSFSTDIIAAAPNMGKMRKLSALHRLVLHGTRGPGAAVQLRQSLQRSGEFKLLQRQYARNFQEQMCQIDSRPISKTLVWV